MTIFFLSLLLWMQVPDLEESFAFGLSLDWRIHDSAKALDGPSHWFVEDGVLHQESRIRGPDFEGDTDPIATRIVLMDPSKRNGAFLVKMSLQEEGAIGLLFRVRDESHYYQFVLIDEGDSKDSELRLERRDGDEVTPLAGKRIRLPYPAGPWWILGVEMNDASFRITLDDEPLLNAEDDAYAAGGIGIGCGDNAGLRVDSLRLCEKTLDRSLFKPRPALLKGPVIKNLCARGFELIWETGSPSSSMVEVIDGAQKETFGDESESVLFHHVKVHDLESGKAYRYKVISGDVLSPVYGIQLPPESFTDFSFCVYGCSYGNPDAHRFVIRSISRRTPNLVFHVGDLVENGAHYEQWFPQFFDPADWIIHSLPYLHCMGTHEKGTRWPQVLTSLAGGMTYYTYTFGPAFFVILDSNLPLEEGAPQEAWLDGILRSKEALQAKWKFCFIHDPFGYGDKDAECKVPSSLATSPLPVRLDDAGFDMFFMGRSTCYSRSTCGSLHLVNTGGGGAPPDMEAATWKTDDEYFIVQRSVWHACKVQIEGDALEFMAFTPDGKPFDSIKIVK